MTQISVAELYNHLRHKLTLTWVAGFDGGENLLTSNTVSKPSLALIGHLNFVHPHRVQVLGCAEMDFLRSQSPEDMLHAIQNLFATDIAAVVVANEEAPPITLLNYANQKHTPLFTSSMQSPRLMELLQHYLSQSLAESTSLHGVFMEVQGFGVLIKGTPAIGKSELALELISRGHRLICDDVVDLFRISPEQIEGRCPPMLQDFLEVRGLGILNIRELFGDNAVRSMKALDLIIHLEIADLMSPKNLDRLQSKIQYENILDINIPIVTIPIAAGRNIAVLVEVAIRNHMLLQRGINTSKQLEKRQQQEMKRQP